MQIQNSIEIKLKESLDPVHLSVQNESHLHRHSAQNAETHFRIEVVSADFEDKRMLERHRLVNQILLVEFNQIKAFSLYALTPQEWESKQKTLPRSPTCAGQN